MIIQLFLLFLLIVKIENTVISTKYGKINGFDYKTESGRVAEIYLGIPFAQPPINNLKFEVSFWNF